MEVTEYWNEVTALADAVLEERPSDLDDYLHELVQFHEFIIYPAKALWVIMHSPNDAAVEDVCNLEEMLGSCRSVGDIYTTIAYWALLEDVRRELDDRGYGNE